jgi:hypothetical protein
LSARIAPLAVITNRASTLNARQATWIDSWLSGQPDTHHFVVGGAADLPAVIARCRELGVATLVVNGGDGTASLVFSALLEHGTEPLPAVALLPAGDTNMTATRWGVGATKEEGLARLLELRRSGTLENQVETRTLLGVDPGGGKSAVYGAFFGAADVVEGILFCRRNLYPLPLPRGISHAAALGVLTWRCLMQSGHGSDVAVHHRAKLLESGRFFMIVATALDEMLLGMRPTPADGPEIAASFHYMSLRPGTGAALRAVPRFLRRRIVPARGLTVRRVERLTLSFDGPYTVDGEMYTATADRPLVLHAARSLRFVRGAS